jgi:chromosome segregation and condensation protein ScpB
MFKLVVVGTIAALAYATPISDSMVKTIRSKTSTW